MKVLEPLGISDFNYQDYTVWRFIHYWHQIELVLRLRPKSVLEIGPGDHTVSDFLIRKGIDVSTLDNHDALKPDYLIDLLDPNFTEKINQKFDICLASQVLEHVSFGNFISILKKLAQLAEYLVISVPYTTIRLFPERPDYGKIISCEGRLMTHIPHYFINIPLSILRFSKSVLMREGFQAAKSRLHFGAEQYPETFHGHHWDCGFWPFRPSMVRKALMKNFIIHREIIYVSTNCIFWVLSVRHTN
jgi:hypothetical protein